MRLLAQSYSSEAVEWLRNTKVASVISSFERALNLVDDHGRLISIVAPESRNGPLAIVLLESPESLGQIVFAGAAALVGETSLTIDKITIDFSKTKIWCPRPDWDCVLEGSDDVTKSICDLKPILQCKASCHSLAPVLFSSRYQMDHYCAKASDAAYQICHGISNSYTQDIVLGVGTIAGLGIGLTPSGDDFLVGIMHALWTVYDSEEAVRLSSIITAAATPRTTILSAAWLREASKGHASESWHDLLYGIVMGHTNDAKRACMRILRIGGTSGADALTGFLFAIQFFRDFERKRSVPYK